MIIPSLLTELDSMAYRYKAGNDSMVFTPLTHTPLFQLRKKDRVLQVCCFRFIELAAAFFTAVPA